MKPSEKLTELAQKREKKELEQFIRKIVKEELEILLNAKFDSERILTVNEVKERYKTSVSTINRHINAGNLKFIQSLTKGRRTFRKADCDAVFLKTK